jgi:hypothetical protein
VSDFRGGIVQILVCVFDAIPSSGCGIFNALL